MENNRFIIFLLGIFVATIFLVGSLQYSSNNNINQLIRGNQDLLSEFKIKSKVQRLIVDLTYISTEERKIIDRNIRTGREAIDQRIKEVHVKLAELKEVSASADTRNKLGELETAIAGMLGYYTKNLDNLYANSGTAPGELLAYSKADTLANQIMAIANYLITSKDNYLISLIEKTDIKARSTKRTGWLLSITAILTSIYAFGYILNKVGKQRILISRLNQTEKEVRNAALIKENFMANMSHEIRTPMNAILGFTNLLQKEPLGTKAKEFLDSIQRAGENLLTIINDVLDFSKIEAGMMRIESNAFSLRGLLHSVETMFAFRLNVRQLLLSVHIEDSIPDVLKGDAVRLTQIMVNLVNNAVKFTDHGSIKINVTGAVRDQETILLTFSIKDTGIGIPANKIETIFDRFHQASEDTTRKYGGTGLGLAIVKQLVELQNGHIQVNSMENEGTEFIFTLPYKLANEVVDITKQTFFNKNEKKMNGINSSILLVEDNEMNQNLMKHLLTDWNLNFDMVANGKEAIQAVEIKKYAMILMDIQMPEMDGYTATKIIRNELRSDVPIIAMTAHAIAGEREKCLSYGMNEYISKPIRENELFRILHEFMDHQISGMKTIPEKAKYEFSEFKFINLQYLNELSAGNLDFEKVMVQNFLGQVPTEIESIKNAFNQSNYLETAAIAHNMKTSVSFLGLLDKTDGILNFIEANAALPTEKTRVRQNIAALQIICRESFSEAQKYLQKIS